MTKKTGEGATSELTELRNLIIETQTATQSSIQQLGDVVGALTARLDALTTRLNRQAQPLVHATPPPPQQQFTPQHHQPLQHPPQHHHQHNPAPFQQLRHQQPVPPVTEFVAQLQFLELLDNVIVTAGYKAILHIHEAVEECEIIELISQIDKKTRKPMKKKLFFVKNGAVVVCRIQVTNPIRVEKFSDFPQLGRFTLRTHDEGKIIAVGKVTALSGVSSSA
ncbi:eukaryotic peptide chain release factor GTP-binding subunit-like [Raphanus sativus]|uniref:Eukaryotic peptide chain release factor GTP-binding subunit-like n=1 Tax=Raphanus sativus TaxID=3726 RepID=A0A9W3DMF7_RAPSA|nr:eukaryotic peptide chain release factor GTP-binding subunit-like [Raphanus sativus]